MSFYDCTCLIREAFLLVNPPTPFLFKDVLKSIVRWRDLSGTGIYLNGFCHRKFREREGGGGRGRLRPPFFIIH